MSKGFIATKFRFEAEAKKWVIFATQNGGNAPINEHSTYTWIDREFNELFRIPF